MNTIYTGSSNALYAFNYELHELCRICGAASNDLNSMFDDNGSAYDFSSKINEYLPIRVRKSDFLPQKICSMCASTLLSFHQLYIVCQSTNARFIQSLEGEAYDHHVVKSHVVGDTSELLELQSSFSREIENEILNMHESKEINEAESEIAANAAVKELERIGSAENISFVEDVAMDTLNTIDDIKSDSKSMADGKNTKKTNENAIKNKSKKEPIKKQPAKVKSNEIKQKNNAKEKVRPIKSPKNGINAKSKDEILSENVTTPPKTDKLPNGKPQSNKTNNVQTKDVHIKEVKAEKNTCNFCNDSFDTKDKMIVHIKDLHNDLIFHCEVCDDYLARDDLISHMLNHALNPNGPAKEASIESNETQNDTNTPAPVSKTPPKNNGETKPSQNGTSQKSKTNHIQENNQPAAVKAVKSTKSTKTTKPHYCAECDKTFADSGGYKYHINAFHKKIKKYECDICGNHFSCKRVITNHLRGVHMKERIFECDQCSKKFSTDSALYMHKKIHENVFKCVCQVCDRRFRSMSKLKIHMTMHTKEKNYFCEICQRGFAVRNNLTKHMLTHSKSFDFKCTKCSYKANQRRYLAEHIKRSHKTPT